MNEAEDDPMPKKLRGDEGIEAPSAPSTHGPNVLQLAAKSMPKPIVSEAVGEFASSSGIARPRSPSRSPNPRQRDEIRRNSGVSHQSGFEIRIFPADWQCPTVACVNHRRNVFARKLKCPVCGADRPAEAQSERGQFFRRRASVSPHDRRSRAYTGADGLGVTGSFFPPSPLVGSSDVLRPLQVESFGLLGGKDEVKHFEDDSGSHGVGVNPQVPLVGSVHLGGFNSSVASGDEVAEVW